MLFIIVLTSLIASCSNSVIHELGKTSLKSSSNSFETYPAKYHDTSRLILTPYIEDKMYDKARSLAAVNYAPFTDGLPSYSGYLTVNKKFNSNIFFWFFPAQNDYENAPVLLWLQGGPGTSSLFGLFTEIGPFRVAEDNYTLVENPYSWHKNHSLIFIDNPVGTGFSFTDFSGGFATNQTQIGEELYSALVQFFTLFSELRTLPFFIAGESYGGKYVPALGYTIHKKNPTAKLKINLEGLAVGNGWTDPENMMDLSSFLFHLGYIDNNIRNAMHELETQAVQAIQRGDFEEAHNKINHVYSIFHDHTDLDSIYNFIGESDDTQIYSFIAFLEREDVRKALHVGDVEFSSQDSAVYFKLEGDIMQSVRPWLEELLEHYRVLYYSGQLDIIVAYHLSMNMFNRLNFSAAEEYRNATRVPWHVKGSLAGYMKSAGKFTEVLVRNAGHLVPMDQPAWAFDLINRFTRDDLVYPNHHHYARSLPLIPWLRRN